MSENDSKEIAAAFGGGDNLPTAFSPQALMASAAKLPKTSENPFLSFKDGEWTFGASQDECEAGALWAIDPTSFGNGLMEWCDGKPGGEVYVPMGAPFDADDVSFKHDPKHPKWALPHQVGCVLVCLNGTEKGLKVLYKTSTKGGVDCLAGMATKIGQAAQGESPDNYVPVVTLEFSTYRHKTYGKKWVPVLKVQAWDDINISTTLAELDAEAKPSGTSKKAAKAAAQSEETTAETEGEEAPPPARRRRKS